ncbi:hypothetical protein [Streptomyces sp. N2A]|uniref:hypothetical protein n=1 Tax=Streptomyces sp. N2A TaxID=3073936 RepID=UPI0028703CF4|nr:hypothetical protein [Streptomyces sp. N2A]
MQSRNAIQYRNAHRSSRPSREAPEVLDISRLKADTGYQAEYDTERAVGDYIAWLRAGNPN